MKHYFTKPLQGKQAFYACKAFIILFFLLCSFSMYGQTTVKGTVVDEKNQPLTGVNVVVKGKQVGAVTDIDGNYSLQASPSDVLQYTFLGYKPEEIPVGNQTVINITLKEDVQQLNEVVVIGYGVQKKSDVTGAVASVKSEQLTQLSTSNVSQAMQGRVAGVMVTANSGEPGAGMKVRIRGTSSINNSDPLYVVDGFPVGDIDFLSPTDIQSMEILKDASATAIYGNRGANGVILITTKKGKAEKTSVTFNISAGLMQPRKKIDVLNAQEYAKAKLMAYENDSAVRKWRTPNGRIRNNISRELRDTLNWVLRNNYQGTDWQDEILRDGSFKNYVVNVSGGSEKYKYDVSGSYYKEDGIIINSWFEKYLLRYGSQMEIFKFLNADMNISYHNTERTNYDRSLYGAGILPPALYADPISIVYDAGTDPKDKEWGQVDVSQTTNPVAAADRMRSNRTNTDQILINLGGELKILPGLTFNSKYGTIITFNRPKRYTPAYSIGLKDLNTNSTLDESHQRASSWSNSNYLNYNKDLGKFNFNLMAGQEWQYFDSYTTRLITQDVPDDPNLYYATARGSETVNINPSVTPENWYEWQTSLLSYFGRAFISFDNRYMLTGTFRRDATSKIAKDYRWGTFPSFSAKWNIRNESFMKDMPIISALAARVGWGITGIESSITNMYSIFATLNSGLYMIGDENAQLQGQIQTKDPNPQLKWEEVKQWNYALDFGLFENRISGTVDYFLKNTSGMIVTVPPPVYTGARPVDAATANIGTMENKGVEVSLNIRNIKGDFRYEVGGNITFLSKPMVKSLAQQDQTITTGTVAKTRGVINTVAGEEMAHFYGYKANGLLTEEDFNIRGATDSTFLYPRSRTAWFPGQIKIEDLNGDGEITVDDMTNIGSFNPDYIYGFNIDLSYKFIDLKVFCQGVQGVEMINTLNAWLKVPDEGDQNLSKEVLKSWTPTNTNTTVPRLVQGNQIFQAYFNDYLVEDASYLRIKNIQLGFTLPSKWSKKVGISNFRFYLSGENLFTMTKYSGLDPEVGNLQFNNATNRNDPLAQGLDDAMYPIAKRYIMGLNITF